MSIVQIKIRNNFVIRVIILERNKNEKLKKVYSVREK